MNGTIHNLPSHWHNSSSGSSIQYLNNTVEYTSIKKPAAVPSEVTPRLAHKYGEALSHFNKPELRIRHWTVQSIAMPPVAPAEIECGTWKAVPLKSHIWHDIPKSFRAGPLAPGHTVCILCACERSSLIGFETRFASDTAWSINWPSRSTPPELLHLFTDQGSRGWSCFNPSPYHKCMTSLRRNFFSTNLG